MKDLMPVMLSTVQHFVKCGMNREKEQVQQIKLLFLIEIVKAIFNFLQFSKCPFTTRHDYILSLQISSTGMHCHCVYFQFDVTINFNFILISHSKPGFISI